MTPITIPHSAVPITDYMLHGDDYAFFDYSDHETDLPTMYGDLLASAEFKICIWDPYFNASKGASEFFVFSRISNGIKIELLSHGTSQNSKIQDSIQHIRSNLDSSIINSVRIDFFWISTDRHAKQYYVHDRFLIIDDSRFFIVGSSWGYHSNVAGERGSTGIFEVKKDKDKNIIKTMYNKYKRVAQIDGTVTSR